MLSGAPVRLGRTATGTAHITAADEAGLAWGTGYVHARDRGRQLLTLRLVGQGRLAECLRDDEASLASDIWFRRAGFAADAVSGAAHLDGPTSQLVQAYCRGVRAGFAAVGTPVEFRAVGYRPAPWAVADTVATMALLGWIGLAQTQAELETALVAAVHQGADPVRLRALFAPHLAGLDDDVVGLLRRLTHLPPPQPSAPAVLPDDAGQQRLGGCRVSDRIRFPRAGRRPARGHRPAPAAVVRAGHRAEPAAQPAPDGPTVIGGPPVSPAAGWASRCRDYRAW